MKDKKTKTKKEKKTEAETTANTETKPKKEKNKETTAKKEKKIKVTLPVKVEYVGETEGEAVWGGIKLHILLQQALLSLNFHKPTPIQIASIPLLSSGKCDLVGAAETGSGMKNIFKV